MQVYKNVLYSQEFSLAGQNFCLTKLQGYTLDAIEIQFELATVSIFTSIRDRCDNELLMQHGLHTTYHIIIIFNINFSTGLWPWQEYYFWRS